MRQVAYHRFVNEGGLVEPYSPVVVVYDDEGKYVSHHQLMAEESCTIWVGGVLDLRKEKINIQV